MANEHLAWIPSKIRRLVLIQASVLIIVELPHEINENRLRRFKKTEQIFSSFFVVSVNVRPFDLLKTPFFCKFSCNISIVFPPPRTQKESRRVFPPALFVALIRFSSVLSASRIGAAAPPTARALKSCGIAGFLFHRLRSGPPPLPRRGLPRSSAQAVAAQAF